MRLSDAGSSSAGWPEEGRLSGQPRGGIRLKVLVFVVVVAAGWYVASKFIPPYWHYLSMQDPVKEALETAARGDEARARQSILQRAGEMGLPLTDEDILFSREGPRLAVRVTWVIPVDLPRYHHELRFQIAHTTTLP